MTDAAEIEIPPRKNKLPLLLGLLMAILGACGGFFLLYQPNTEVNAGADLEETEPTLPSANVSFIALPPIIIPIDETVNGRMLRFAAHLEVDPKARQDIEALMPRVLDVLNTYLRAVDLDMLLDRRALLRLRAQMLRRVQTVTDTQSVKDLLITEFVVN